MRNELDRLLPPGHGDQLDEVASKVKALGSAGYLRSTSHRTGEPVGPEGREA